MVGIGGLAMSSKMYLINSENPFFTRNRAVTPSQILKLGFNSMEEMRVKQGMTPDGLKEIPEKAPCHDCKEEHCHTDSKLCYYFKHLLIQCKLISEDQIQDEEGPAGNCQVKSSKKNQSQVKSQVEKNADPQKSSKMSSKKKKIVNLLRENDLSYEKIGEKVGCSKQYVGQVAKEEGLSRRSQAKSSESQEYKDNMKHRLAQDVIDKLQSQVEKLKTGVIAFNSFFEKIFASEEVSEVFKEDFFALSEKFKLDNELIEECLKL